MLIPNYKAECKAQVKLKVELRFVLNLFEVEIQVLKVAFSTFSVGWVGVGVVCRS